MDGIYTDPSGNKIKVKDGRMIYLVEPTNADGETQRQVEAAAPEAAVSDSETRENKDGIVQQGRNLSSINSLFNSLIEKGQMAPGTQMGTANKYLSSFLPGTNAGQAQLELKPATPEEGAAPEAEKPAPAPQERVDTAVEPTVPETTGQSDSPQEGKSDKPDNADRLRRIREATSNVKPTVEPSDRNKAVSAFLDPRNKGYAAIRARDAAVGADLEGVGGAKFNEGMSRDARFELTGGAADNEEGAQKFAQQYLQKVAGVERTSPKKGIAGSVDSETGKEYMGPAF